MSSSTKHNVTRRRVFYIPGFDPIHPRRYRELYRTEGAAQAANSGYEIEVTGKPRKQGFGWSVDTRIDGHVTHADIDVLVWSDIVRSSMSASVFAIYLQLFRTAWIYVSTGALWRLMRLRKGPVIAALYPVVALLLQALLAIALAIGVYRLISWGFDLTRATVVIGPALLYQLAAVGGGIAAGLRLLRWFKRIDGKVFAHYLMNDYAHSAKDRGAYPAELDARLIEFQRQIASALAQDYDEVLVVGHSSGAHLAISALADLMRAGTVPANGPKLSLLSLGQVVPMVSFLPNAHRLRADLQFLSEQHQIVWVDVTAPGDGCSFALCDPVAVSGVARPGQRWPLVFSAAFTQSLSAERWRALKRRYFRLHFQYLCAFDRPKDYDYFQITAGPETLASRYATRAPSKSMINHSVNKFTSVAA